ncbi:hypothetical protein BTA51_29330 [Hahella sp. CCB-MM4]|uniref:hypothetical protein n=1 Tax=Hahella sp. (strain CCB-MM4) TaxID=1926491 RepID=UPI000B9C02DD|nr:hypothetical protein [Hahella sp. CCB-MM4]OZG69729.1 hypothetical protein BTA51_29330 [Hahella sp. CCB-MM4]
MTVDETGGKATKRSKKKAGKKDAQLLIRINSEERDEFIALCEEQDTSAAREIRKFIRKFIQDNKND